MVGEQLRIDKGEAERGRGKISGESRHKIILEGSLVRSGEEAQDASGADKSGGADAADKTGRPVAIGDRIFHLKFGNGTIKAIESDKLTVSFDKAGEKRIIAGFAEKL